MDRIRETAADFWRPKARLGGAHLRRRRSRPGWAKGQGGRTILSGGRWRVGRIQLHQGRLGNATRMDFTCDRESLRIAFSYRKLKMATWKDQMRVGPKWQMSDGGAWFWQLQHTWMACLPLFANVNLSGHTHTHAYARRDTTFLRQPLQTLHPNPNRLSLDLDPAGQISDHYLPPFRPSTLETALGFLTRFVAVLRL